MKANITTLMTNKMEETYRKNKLKEEQALLDIKNREELQKEEKLNLERKRIDGINANIEFWMEERATICNTLENMKNPISINLNTDIASSAKRYDDLKKQVDISQKQYEDSEKSVVPKFKILQTEIGLTIFVVFIISRITADNDYLLEQITSLSVIEYFYPNIQSPLIVDFFIQDFVIIMGLSIASGVLFSNFKKFRNKKLIIYSSISLATSIVGMMIANYMSML